MSYIYIYIYLYVYLYVYSCTSMGFGSGAEKHHTNTLYTAITQFNEYYILTSCTATQDTL